MDRDLELYVHIPFCAQKCGYCDFLSFASDSFAKRQYIDALTEEIRAVKVDEAYRVSSVFIGGGTPSILPAEYIAGIMETLRGKFPPGGGSVDGGQSRNRRF